MPSMSRSLALFVALTLAACGGADNSEEQDGAELSYGTYVHKLPVGASDAAPRNTAGAHLNYYGGKVLQNVKVVQVVYGAGTYLGNITGTAAPTVASFYGSILQSNYLDWLSEYNTSSPLQRIGRGTFSKKVTITPASSRNGSIVSDAAIQAEISAQIGAGKLPAADNNTIYMINFRKGQHITQGSSGSCVAGGFCAYHGTFKRGSQEVYYGVIPDFSAGSGCDAGCGHSSQFGNTTSVSSHELIEAVTDAEVGLATVVGKPLAWYDPNNGEIGDICNGQQGSINGYTVQLEWSNQKNACIAHK